MAVLAEDAEIKGLGIAKSYGLDVLIKVRGEVIRDELTDTLQNVQIASLEEKKKKTHAALGFSPISFSDATILIPTQLSMIASLTVIFGFDINKSIMSAILSSTIGAGVATVPVKIVVSNLFKLIPGAGTVVGAQFQRERQV